MKHRVSLACVVLVLALVFLGGCVVVSTTPAKPAADFFVSPEGSDQWSGRLPAPNAARTDGPFATLERAREAVREARAREAAPRQFTVLVRGGTYWLGQPIVFEPQDSGAEGAPVVYAAYPGEKPIISGGRSIEGWRRGKGELWVAEIPEVKRGDWYFHQLFVNGQRRTRARTPNTGYLRTDGPLPGFENPHAHRTNREAKMGFRFRKGDLKNWPNLEDVNIFVYHSWTASLHWIKELDEKNGIVRFTAPSNWPMGWWERKQRYHVENYLEALDSPGEWYLERTTGTLYYWPLPGEDMATAEVVAPVLEQLVVFRGDREGGKVVHDIVLRGLSFQHADWRIPGPTPTARPRPSRRRPQ